MSVQTDTSCSVNMTKSVCADEGESEEKGNDGLIDCNLLSEGQLVNAVVLTCKGCPVYCYKPIR